MGWDAAGVSKANLVGFIATTAAARGWRCHDLTNDTGASASGVPDLMLMRHQRLVFVLARPQRKDPSSNQRNWVDALEAVGPPVEVHVWHPADFDRIVETLR